MTFRQDVRLMGMFAEGMWRDEKFGRESGKTWYA